LPFTSGYVQLSTYNHASVKYSTNNSIDSYIARFDNVGFDGPVLPVEVAASVPLIITDDIEAAADAMRPMYALYFGGMGARNTNFHANVPIRMGYEAEVAKIQELYLSGHKDEAAAAVPTKLIEQLTLIGSKDKIRHDLEAWRESIVTTMLVGGDALMLRTAAELVLG